MNRSDKYPEIKKIADAVADQTVTEEQVAELDQLLKDDKQAQAFYHQYITLHLQMQANATPDMEVVRRSLHLEEVIVRPSGANSDYQPKPQPRSMPNIEPKPMFFSKWYILIASIPLLLFMVLFISFFASNKSDALGEVLNGQLRINGLGKIDDNSFYRGSYFVDETSRISLFSGEIMTIAQGSQIKFFNESEIELQQGKLAIEQASGQNIVVLNESFDVHSGGGTLLVDVTEANPIIQAGNNTTLTPKRWRPNHFWPFDSQSDRAIDLAGNASGIPGSGAQRIKGLVGSGAYYFDNSQAARIDVGSGGGTAPATGSFSATDGVTIEALVVPKFTGEKRQGKSFGELDEIFRKDQDDQEHRMLLSFQQDEGKDYLRPRGNYAESLSFGLYLVGQGYHELKLALDGKNNRPTLAELKDGKAHHVVATYNVSSGLKAIYLNGKMLAYYQYPAGSKMLSGGAGTANIGNSPNVLDDREAFFGIIDEVAFYDFALPKYIIQQHLTAIQQGNNYYGFKPNAKPLPQSINIKLDNQVSYLIDRNTGLPIKEQPN
ncbi:pentaxin domain-containing protein [Saccharobesus litoralis]|uniref:Pentaxin domain-containing protein n=1 Tax=Saccharobesus litoralis TaxID=2172099 RepID=A0A2S0VPN6_9ALTE|nr:LamG-like jellyroll fold domain-containing protein [Saccharobesus litoralis]AWB66185.1 pentaxin domain-containing protein [Saccharobesus litoralis]